jgi:hypothetical protein
MISPLRRPICERSEDGSDVEADDALVAGARRVLHLQDVKVARE